MVAEYEVELVNLVMVLASKSLEVVYVNYVAVKD